MAVRHAGRMLRDALDAAVAAVLDESGAQHLGDAQRASADLLAALEGSLDYCERAVAGLREDADVEGCVAAGRAVVAHTRLSAVLLEEVTAGATGAGRPRTPSPRDLGRIRGRSRRRRGGGGSCRRGYGRGDREAEAAAVAEHMADEAANDTAVALVRSAHAGVGRPASERIHALAVRAAAWAGIRPRHPGAWERAGAPLTRRS